MIANARALSTYIATPSPRPNAPSDLALHPGMPFAHAVQPPPSSDPSPVLPPAVTAPREAFSADLPMRSAPSGHAIVHLPAGFDPARPVHLVFFFHGSGVCVGQFLGQRDRCGAALAYGPGCGGPDRFDPLGANAILVIPQLRFGARDVLNHTGALRTLIEELLHETLPAAAGLPSLDVQRLDGITLVAHSAGHRALERGLADPALVPLVRNVVLFDTTPVGTTAYRHWFASAGRRHRLTVLHTGWSAARQEAAAIVEVARRVPGVSATITNSANAIAAMSTHDVVAAYVPFEHGWVPWLYFPKVLGALALPSRRPDGEQPIDPEVTTRGPVQPTPINPGDNVAGDLRSGDALTLDGSAIDAYSLPLAAGQRVVISVRGERSRTDRAVPLDVLAALDDGEREIARDDDSLGGLGSRIEFVAEHGGTYLLRVTTFGAGLREGHYQLILNTH